MTSSSGAEPLSPWDAVPSGPMDAHSSVDHCDEAAKPSNMEIFESCEFEGLKQRRAKKFHASVTMPLEEFQAAIEDLDPSACFPIYSRSGRDLPSGDASPLGSLVSESIRIPSSGSEREAEERAPFTDAPPPASPLIRWLATRGRSAQTTPIGSPTLRRVVSDHDLHQEEKDQEELLGSSPPPRMFGSGKWKLCSPICPSSPKPDVSAVEPEVDLREAFKRRYRQHVGSLLDNEAGRAIKKQEEEGETVASDWMWKGKEICEELLEQKKLAHEHKSFLTRQNSLPNLCHE